MTEQQHPETWRIRVADVTLRFEETIHKVRLLVEGELAPATVDAIAADCNRSSRHSSAAPTTCDGSEPIATARPGW